MCFYYSCKTFFSPSVSIDLDANTVRVLWIPVGAHYITTGPPGSCHTVFSRLT